jgi:hypothetical protein
VSYGWSATNATAETRTLLRAYSFENKNTTLPSRPNANSIATAHYVVAMHAYIPVVGVVQPTGNTRCSFVQQKKMQGRNRTHHTVP